jgi:hypothetical protein
MAGNGKSQEKIIGGAEHTGIVISKKDFDQLIEVIAKARAKDRFMKKLGIGQFGATGTGLEPATMGFLGIQHFMKQLAASYGFKDTDYVMYGVDKHGEILRWLTPDEFAERTKKGG